MVNTVMIMTVLDETEVSKFNIMHLVCMYICKYVYVYLILFSAMLKGSASPHDSETHRYPFAGKLKMATYWLPYC